MAYRVVITKAGGPNVLDIQEIPIPEPGEHEVCIACLLYTSDAADEE